MCGNSEHQRACTQRRRRACLLQEPRPEPCIAASVVRTSSIAALSTAVCSSQRVNSELVHTTGGAAFCSSSSRSDNMHTKQQNAAGSQEERVVGE